MAVIVAAVAVGGGACGSAMGAGQESNDVGVEAVRALERVELVLLAAFPAVLWWLWRADVIRPGSLARRRTRDVTGSPWSVWWVGAVLMLFAQAAGGALGAMLADGRGEAWEKVGLALGAGAAGLAVGVWLAWLLGGGPWGPGAGLSLRARGRDLGLGLVGFLAVMPVMAVATIGSVLVAEAITGRPSDPLAHETLKAIFDDQGSVQTWGLIFTAVVLAPMVEEILFRGLVQSGVLRLTRRVWPSILATSMVFGAVHIGSVATHALVPLCVFGVCLGVAYERTGRLWVPITMHMLFNAVNIAVTLAG